jgi:hypothetical protein
MQTVAEEVDPERRDRGRDPLEEGLMPSSS